MKPTATRLVAWIALTLVAGATLGLRVAPAVDASLTSLTELCAPPVARPNSGATAQAPKPERIPLRVPRCGVA